MNVVTMSSVASSAPIDVVASIPSQTDECAERPGRLFRGGVWSPAATSRNSSNQVGLAGRGAGRQNER
jgi:hypothetical protein